MNFLEEKMMNATTKQPWIYRETDSSLGCLKWFRRHRISIHQCLTGCQFTNAGNESLLFFFVQISMNDFLNHVFCLCSTFGILFTSSIHGNHRPETETEGLFLLVICQDNVTIPLHLYYYAETRVFTLNYPNMPCKTSSNMTGFFTVGFQVFNDGWKRSDSVDFTFQPVWCWEFAMPNYHDSRSHVFLVDW